VGPQVRGGVGPVLVKFEEPPAGERAEPLHPVPGVVVDDFEINGVEADGGEGEAATEFRGPELHGQPAGQAHPARPAPPPARAGPRHCRYGPNASPAVCAARYRPAAYSSLIGAKSAGVRSMRTSSAEAGQGPG